MEVSSSFSTRKCQNLPLQTTRDSPHSRIRTTNIVCCGDQKTSQALADVWRERHRDYAFLQLSMQNLIELSRREQELARRNKPFLSLGGLDFLFGQVASNSCTATNEEMKCIHLYQKSLIIYMLGHNDYQSLSEERLLRQLYSHYLSFIIIDSTTNTMSLVKMIENAFKFKRDIEFPNNPALNRYVTLSLPFYAQYQKGDTTIRNLIFSDSNITQSFTVLPKEKTNRMIDRYGAENLLVADFKSKMKSKDIVEILSKGIYLDGEIFQFVGCSSSGLKKRSCFMMRGTPNDIKRVRDTECAKFSNATSIPKKLKGIGLLFSNASPTGIEIKDECIKIRDDILTDDRQYNFTDGCGAIGSELHKRITEKAIRTDMLPQGYKPSVFQIRLKGYKGVVALDPSLDKDSILIRKSMIKFESGTKPFPQIWLCNYSRPYTTGYLNKQYIMLLSGLGVPDEVLEKKQSDYYDQMVEQNPAVSFDQLCISGQYALAVQVATGNYNRKEVQDELTKMRRKFHERLPKLKIQIRDSRNVFGICDTSRVLDYGECFFRPTINNQPRTLSGKVIIAKNPCYFLGDVRILTAVNGSRVQHLSHLVDCIVFPTKGSRPHPDEITGSDLDGDEYFICWDKDLSIERLRNPTDFLALANASTSKRSHWRSCVDYFASQVNMMGLLDSNFMYWAETKGVISTECLELGQLFSRSVDASKTGDKFVIPKHLIPPEQKSTAQSTAVWKKMEALAVKCKQQFIDMAVQSSDDVNVAFNEVLIRAILQNKVRGMPEYELFGMLKKWCHGQYPDESDCKEKLVEFSKHINFGKLTLRQKIDVVEVGIPIKNVTNALNLSQLLTTDMMQKFNLHDPHNRWFFFFESTSADFNWADLLHAVTTYPESMVVYKLPNGITFALHFLTRLDTGQYEIKAGSIISYLFSPSFQLLHRHVLGSSFSIDLNADFLQLYRNGERRNTFVWIKSKVLELKDLSESEFDRISVDLTTFQKDIIRKHNHPKVNKEQFDTLEVYVKSGTEEPTYYDQLPSDLACENADSLEDDGEDLEVIPREGGKEEEKGVPLAEASLLELLKSHACHGRIGEFSATLQLVLLEEGKESLREQLGDALRTLLTVIAKKYVHLCTPAMHLDDLLSIITSLDFAISSPHICFFILHKISLLQSTDLTEQVASMVMSCIKLSSLTEYMEILLHWEWWYFLPQSVAKSISKFLYTLSLSLISDSARLLPDIRLQHLCRNADKLSMTPKGWTERYVHHCSYLFHCSFLEEIETVRSRTTNEEAISKLKICDAKNPHQQYSTTNEWSEEGNAKKGKSYRRIEFHRSKGIVSNVDGHVVVGFMTSDIESKFITHGFITELSKQPTNIVVEISEPLPECVETSIRSGFGHWQLNCVGNVTSFVRGIKAISSLAESDQTPPTSLASILVHPEGAVYDGTSITTATGNYVGDIDEHDSYLHFKPDSTSLFRDLREVVKLNEKQEEAVISSLNQSLTLIHGPPGTGKTRIACEIVIRYCYQRRNNEDKEHAKVLVASETNMAVDNLARQLMELGVNIVRIGSKEVSSDIYSQICLESLVARKSPKKMSGHIDRKIATEILKEADVVAATCVGAGDSILKSFRFPFIIIDEATQVKEPISLIPITKKCCQLTLIGDPEQLAPFHHPSQSSWPITSSTPNVGDLAVTLFHRLQKVVPSVLLEEQYRMSPKLVEFPSLKFYNGKLRCSPHIEERVPNFELKTVCKPIDFIDIASSQEMRVGSSFKNEDEANVVVDVVNYLIRCNVSPCEVTVLTPYKKQFQCLSEKLSKQVSHVQVSTIDNFQGKENDVIVFSMVRSKPHGDLDFIADRKRINVLLTRAKYYVIGVGNKIALQKIDLWKDWLEQANDVTLERLSVVDYNSKTARPKDRHHPRGRVGQHQRGGNSRGGNSRGDSAHGYSQHKQGDSARSYSQHQRAGDSAHGHSQHQRGRGHSQHQRGGGSQHQYSARSYSQYQQGDGHSQHQHGDSAHGYSQGDSARSYSRSQHQQGARDSTHDSQHQHGDSARSYSRSHQQGARDSTHDSQHQHDSAHVHQRGQSGHSRHVHS